MHGVMGKPPNVTNPWEKLHHSHFGAERNIDQPPHVCEDTLPIWPWPMIKISQELFLVAALISSLRQFVFSFGLILSAPRLAKTRLQGASSRELGRPPPDPERVWAVRFQMPKTTTFGGLVKNMVRLPLTQLKTTKNQGAWLAPPRCPWEIPPKETKKDPRLPTPSGHASPNHKVGWRPLGGFRTVPPEIRQIGVMFIFGHINSFVW